MPSPPAGPPGGHAGGHAGGRAVEVPRGARADGAGPDARDHAERLQDAVGRQRGRCFWCARAFTDLVPPTTDHVVPRVKGGPSWAENEVAACRRCNAQRGHVAPADWLEECLRRGWPAEPAALAAALEALDRAIERRGGQRRARPYLRAQRRRVARLSATARGPG